MRMYVLIHMHACTHVHLYKEYCIIWGSKMTFLVTLYVYHSLLMSLFYQLGWSLVITHLYWIFLVHCIWSFSKLCYNFCLAFKCNLENFFFIFACSFLSLCSRKICKTLTAMVRRWQETKEMCHAHCWCCWCQHQLAKLRYHPDGSVSLGCRERGQGCWGAVWQGWPKIVSVRSQWLPHSAIPSLLKDLP